MSASLTRLGHEAAIVAAARAFALGAPSLRASNMLPTDHFDALALGVECDGVARLIRSDGGLSLLATLSHEGRLASGGAQLDADPDEATLERELRAAIELAGERLRARSDAFRAAAERAELDRLSPKARATSDPSARSKRL